MAAFHPPAAERAANSAAQHVETSLAATAPLWVAGPGMLGLDPVAAGALFDELERSFGTSTSWVGVALQTHCSGGRDEGAPAALVVAGQTL